MNKINRRTFIRFGSLATTQLALAATPGKSYAGTDALFFDVGDSLNRLQQNFLNPADAYKPSCYWWWFNNWVNKAGITRDLTEFKAKGIADVLLIQSVSGFGSGPIPRGPELLSAEWRGLFQHALQEANRLQITVGINLCSGWAMGGPWIQPQHAGRWLLQSRVIVTGPTTFSGQLPLPGNRDGYDNAKQLFVKNYVDLPLEQLDYQNSAVIAIPHQPQAALTGDRAKALAAKSNRHDASSHAHA
jgi:hypothetical protein